MYGILKINGVQNYFIANLLVDVRLNIIFNFKFYEILGCFALFCPWCMGCSLAKRLGESSIIGCCPGSATYLRTKLRTARRIDVCR
jgi:hypothetical protein